MQLPRWFVNRICKSSSGAALIEMTLVIPVLLMVFLASVELSRMLRIQQILSSLSRELSSTAIRDCRGNASSNCLQAIAARINQVAQGELPGVRLGVSLWRWDNSDPANPTCVTISSAALSGFVSRYDASDFDGTPLQQACQDFQNFGSGGVALGTASLAIGESQVSYSPVVESMGPLFQLSSRELYVVSIF